MNNPALQKVAQETVLSAANTGKNVVKTTEVASETGLRGVELASNTGIAAAKIGSNIGLRSAENAGNLGLKAQDKFGNFGVEVALQSGKIGELAMNKIGNTAVEGSTEIAKTSFENANTITKESFGIAIDLLGNIRAGLNYIPKTLNERAESRKKSKDVLLEIKRTDTVSDDIKRKFKTDNDIVIKNSENILSTLKDNLLKEIDYNNDFFNYRTKIRCKENSLTDLYYSNRIFVPAVFKTCDDKIMPTLKSALLKLKETKSEIKKMYSRGISNLKVRSLQMQASIGKLSNENSYIEFINSSKVDEILSEVEICINSMHEIYDKGIGELKLIIDDNNTTNQQELHKEGEGGFKRRTNKSKKSKKSKTVKTVKKRKNKSLRKKNKV
jgi:hypothetical protein